MKVHRMVKAVDPDLVTLVEFDQEWRKLPLPGSGNDEDDSPTRDYALAPGGNVVLQTIAMVVEATLPLHPCYQCHCQLVVCVCLSPDLTTSQGQQLW